MENTEKVSPGATLFIVCVVQFLAPYMMSAVGVALPTIGKEFSASAAELGLVETIYILAVSVFLVPAGRIADIKGRKKVYTLGVIIFTCATFFISLSKTMAFFIVFRFLQGLGASLVVSTSMAILTSVFPGGKRGRVMGIVLACVYGGLSAGPGLGGILVTYLGWRWVFYVVVPFLLIAVFLTVFKLKGEWIEAKGESFDWAGSLIYMISFFCFVFGAYILKHDIKGLLIMGFGLAAMICFVFFEYFSKSPIFDVRLLKSNRVFAFSNLATLINYAASFGITFLFSLYLQVTKGLSPKNAGFILLIQPVIQTFLSPWAGKLSDKYSSSKIATIGMIICAGSIFLCTFISADTSLGLIYIILVVMGIGFSLFSSPNMNAVMGSVEPKHYGIAGSLVATMRTFGMLTSMTCITLLFSLIMGDLEVVAETSDLFLKSMQSAMLIFSGLSLFGVLSSMVRIKK